MTEKKHTTVCLVPMTGADFIIALKFDRPPKEIVYLSTKYLRTGEMTKGGYRVYREASSR